MEAILKELAGDTALATEVIAVVMIAYGAAEALLRVVMHIAHRGSPAGWRKEIFVRFGIWLILGLQYALAADIVRSAIAPSWNDIGQLAAVAAIRTFLNYFLERDVNEVESARAQP